MPEFVRFYPGENVVEAAKDRLRWLYKNYDHVVIAFSGGKDSLALLELARQVGVEELHACDKVTAWFRDEEIIPTSVVEFLDGMRSLPWLDLHWWAVPLRSATTFMGVATRYVQWDPERDPERGGVGWVRDRPDYAITLESLGLEPGTVLSQYSADGAFADSLPGRGSIGQATGIRCSESLLRYAAIMTGGRRGRQAWQMPPTRIGTRNRLVGLTRPIYDWAEDDVFRFFYDHGIPYCTVYDDQMWVKRELRVATSITSAQSRLLHKLRVTDPDHVERLFAVFPQMAAQMRYINEFDMDAMIDVMAVDWATLRQWVIDNQEGDLLDKALELVDYHETREAKGLIAHDVRECARRLIRSEHMRSAASASVGAKT